MHFSCKKNKNRGLSKCQQGEAYYPAPGFSEEAKACRQEVGGGFEPREVKLFLSGLDGRMALKICEGIKDGFHILIVKHVACVHLNVSVYWLVGIWDFYVINIYYIYFLKIYFFIYRERKSVSMWRGRGREREKERGREREKERERRGENLQQAPWSRARSYDPGIMT